jgi:hypothetical protein
VTGRSRLQVFVLIDGLGWRILEDRDFLSKQLPHRAPLRTVLGYSSGAIPTILTGKPPAEHGHWNLIYYDPESSPFRWLRHLDVLPEGVLGNRVARKLLKEAGRRLFGLGPLFDCCVAPRLLPWFNWTEKRNIYDRAGVSGARTIFDQLAEAKIPYRAYSYHQWTDAEIFGKAERDIETGDARFLFVYLSELDRFLHSHRSEPDLVEERLEWYASRLRHLLDTARKRDPEACLTIFSDHGMTPVSEHYELVQAVEKLDFKMPTDYLAVYDSTMARFWFFNEEARRQTVQLLQTLPCGRIVADDELRELGILFPDRRYGEVVFLLRAGWIVGGSDFSGRGWAPTGMHGYDPEDPDSHAVFLSTDAPATTPRSLADAYQCMRGVLS